MSREDIIRELEKSAPPALREGGALRKAQDLHLKVGTTISPEALDDILKLAEKIHLNSLPEDDSLFNYNADHDYTPQDLVSSDYLVRKIAFWVEQIREKLFGAPEPPFVNDPENALSWVETTARHDLESKNAGKSGPESKQLQAEEQQVPFLLRSILIPSNNRVKQVWVQPGTLLYELSRRIEDISRATGFKKHSLCIYILTGLEPLLPRVTIGLDLGRAEVPQKSAGSGNLKSKLARRSLKIEIHSADITPQELKKIYDKYRRDLKIRKTKALSNEQVKLFLMVNKNGGPPKKGSKAFWENIRDTWNSEQDNKPYKSWEGVYQRYKIVERKMENLFVKS